MIKDLLAIIVVGILMTLLLGITSHSCEVRGDTTPDVGLWLARSCVGEAGFLSGQTGECAAIAHIYRKRCAINGYTYFKTMRMYSAAIKYQKPKRRWIFHLNREFKRPKGWPERLKWQPYCAYWSDVLLLADAFHRGEVPDPLPQADHYGGIMDHWRAQMRGWKMLKTDFRNRFYRVRR